MSADFSRPLIVPALHDPRNPSLSFFNVAELHVLAATRRFDNVSMQKIRNAIDYLNEQQPSPHPLIAQDFFTDGKDLFIKRILETVNLSKKGQLAFKEIVDVHLDRLEPDTSGWPGRLYPIRHRDISRRPIVIVPDVGGGHPITPKKGIRVSVLLSRKHAGSPISRLPTITGLQSLKSKKAVRYMEAA